MKIHYTGTIWHAGVSENLRRALEELGHEVFFFEKHLSRSSRIARNIAMRLVRRPYEVENYFFEAASRRWLETLKDFKPDLIIIEDAPNILASYVKDARALGKPIFYFEHSPPHGSGAREALSAFEHVDEAFCIERDWFKYINFFFLKEVRHLSLGGNDWDFYPIEAEKKIYDVVFVASAPEQTPDGLLRAKLVDSIPKKYSVAVFGNGWDYWLRRFPGLRERVKSAHAVSNKDANLAYNRAKIVLTYHSTGQLTSLGVRTFDVALAGAFQLVDLRPNSDFNILFPRDSFAYYKDLADLIRQIAYWLPRDKERKEMAEKARGQVLENYTWKKQAQKILAVAANYRNS